MDEIRTTGVFIDIHWLPAHEALLAMNQLIKPLKMPQDGEREAEEAQGQSHWLSYIR